MKGIGNVNPYKVAVRKVRLARGSRSWLCGLRVFSSILCVSLVACSAPTFSGDAPLESDISISDDVEGQNEVAAFLPEARSNEQLLASNSEQIGIDRIGYDGFEQVVIKTNGAENAFEVERISNPDRLVVDLDKSAHSLSSSISSKDSQAFSKIRFGEHADKSRLVFDLVPTTTPIIHSVHSDDKGDIVITFASEEKAAIATALVEDSMFNSSVARAQAKAPASNGSVAEADIVPVADSFEEPSAAGIAPALPESIVEDKKSVPELQLVADEQATSTSESAASDVTTSLTDLKIEQLGQSSNRVIAEMNSAGFYTFSKTAPTEYVLTLEGAELSKEFQPLVASRGSGTIRSVRAVKTGNNVQVRVFSEPGTFLRVNSQGSTLSIEPASEVTRAAEDIMAQAAIEEEGTADAELEEFASDELVSDDELTDFFAVDQKYSGRLISLDLQDTEIDNALRIIAEVSNLNIIASDDVTGKVTLRLIDVPWDQALDVILKTNGLDKVQEGNVVRIAPVEKLRAEREALKQAQQAEEELEPLRVQYIRVSYAKAAELQPLVETVITERGTVAYDDRSNQLIVKDISKGLKNVARLVQKLDLRTPQVLIETQIVEAQRSFVRELGSELGFFMLRTPETGNPTSYNFPNSISIGGSANDSEGVTQPGSISFFPASNASSAVSMLFGSADGTKGLDLRLSQAENEGRVRVVSRPSVAVTNNAPAVIKSVTKLRIKLPSGGVSVATGQGSSAAGGGSVATEVIEVGIVLNVTAQASPDYYVLLDLDAKSSSLGPIGDSVDNIPPEIERSATSSVLVSSGQTFAMGGIYRISEDNSNQGTPFLKDVPVLGHFFRRTQVDDLDEELIFFITPRIIEGSFDDAAMKALS